MVITSNPLHPSFQVQADNFGIIFQKEFSLEAALEELYERYGCERLTIQSGGTMNGLFLREKLIDYADIVVAPILIGGKETSTLIDGPSITSKNELRDLGVLQLISCETLEDSYLRLRYRTVRPAE